jgi:hypothetical protein
MNRAVFAWGFSRELLALPVIHGQTVLAKSRFLLLDD